MHSLLRRHWLYLCVFLGICMGCDSSRNESAPDSKASTENILPDKVPTTSQADTNGIHLNSSERKFIRTADVKFKTHDVTSTTQEIESLARKHNGFVTHTYLTSSVINSSIFSVSADSLLEQKEFIVENSMTIRVPNSKLDTLLYEVNKYADFIDFRIVKADDIHLELLANNLKAKRTSDAENRYTKAIDNNSKKLNEHINAEEQLLALQNNADSHMLSNLAYLDKVNFSTVSLNFYQPSTFQYNRFINHHAIKTFKPSLSHRLLEAFTTGWSIFEELLIFLVSIWTLILITVAGLWLYNKLKMKHAEKF